MRWLFAFLTCSVGVAAPPDPQALAVRIDKHIDTGLKAAHVPPTPQADDAEFLRRVYLDFTGRIPAPRDVYTFLADTDPNKRAKVIDELLETPRYASHAATIWRAILAPETAAVPEARLFRVGFEAWLKQRFRTNTHYDALVRELLTADISPDPANPTPVLRKPDDPNPLAFYAVKEAKPENLAAATTRVFLGVQIECAQCHNHPFAKWTSEQFWNQAAFFTGIERNGDGFFAPIAEKLDARAIRVGDTKKKVGAVFLDDATPTDNKSTRLRSELANWIARKDNPYFARTGANRLWGQMFGRGLVDPVDDFHDDNAPSHPDLLDELGKAFAEANFDIRFLLRAIARTNAYQRSSIQTDAKQSDPRLFARMTLKGLTGEQLFDSLVQATGYREGTGRNSSREQFLTRFALTGKPAEPETSIPQALALMNGRLIADVTTIGSSPTLTAACELPDLTTAERIECLYVSAFGRKPTKKEFDRITKHLHDAGTAKQNEALGDVFWALLNSAEFRMNH